MGMIDFALGMLGLSDADKATVDAAIPIVDNLVTLVNANQGLFNQLYTEGVKVLPAAQILADAINKKGGVAKFAAEFDKAQKKRA